MLTFCIWDLVKHSFHSHQLYELLIKIKEENLRKTLRKFDKKNYSALE